MQNDRKFQEIFNKFRRHCLDYEPEDSFTEKLKPLKIPDDVSKRMYIHLQPLPEIDPNISSATSSEIPIREDLYAWIKENASLIENVEALNRFVLQVALLTNCEEIIQALIDVGLDVDATDNVGRTPQKLPIIGHYYSSESWKFIEDYQFPYSVAANIFIFHTWRNRYLLKIVKCKTSYQAIRCLMLNTTKYRAMYSSSILLQHPLARIPHPINMAAYYGNLELLNLLLDSGADVNERSGNLETPLIIALERKHTEVANVLLERGADPYLPDNIHKYAFYVTLPVHRAMRNRCREILLPLAKHMVKFGGQRALNMLFMMNQSRFGVPFDEIKHFISILMEFDLDINAKDENGRTLLHNIVCNYWHVELIYEFLEYGAELEATDKDGNTPLHLAYRNEYRKMVCYLLDHWADQTVLNNDGLKPSEMTSDEICISYTSEMKYALQLLKGEEATAKVSYRIKDGCMKELHLLKKVEGDYSLYDMFTMPMHKFMICIRNRKFMKYEEACSRRAGTSKLHIYRRLIFTRFKMARLRYKLIYSNLGTFNKLIKGDYPDFVAETIYQYLSDQDIRNIVKAVS